jgi:MFS family permease
MPFLSPGRGFVLLYALAFAGVFVSFMPFVMVLLPLKALAVGGEGHVELLSAAALGGAAVASVANIGFGAWSDAMYRRRGTRRPLAGAGLGLLVLSYLALHLAYDPTTLLAAVAVLQIALNLLFSPIIAIMADEIPDDRKGLVAGMLGIAQPIGTLSSVLVILPGLGGEGPRYALLCAIFAAMIAPFLLGARESALSPPLPPPPLRRRRRKDFALAWTSRMLLQVAGNGLSTYGFYYFLWVARLTGAAKGSAASSPIVLIMSGATLLAVFLTMGLGRLSDRMMRRKPFLALAALGMAGGMAIMAWADSWTLAAAGYGIALCGVSVFLAIHSALAMQLLPSPEHRGRDLGVLNLTNTLPAMVAPLLALLLTPEKSGYGPWLLTLALGALVGGGVAMLVRSQD